VNRSMRMSSFESGLAGMATDSKLTVLNVPDYNLIANKSPNGSYDRRTRENLYWIIEKLRVESSRLTTLERRLLEKFGNARFVGLEEKEKKIKFELVRYRLSKGVKRWIKLATAGLFLLVAGGWMAYQFGVTAETRQAMDLAYLDGLKQFGMVSRTDYENIQEDYSATSKKLEETRKNNAELSQRVEQMILNNQVAENFQHILKQIYLDPGTKYVKRKGRMALLFNDREIANYKTDPDLWYVLGIIDSGKIRVYYDDQEVIDIDAIFGRQGEETPTGEYRVVNKVHKPTWYKKEMIDGKTRVRAIPFGHIDHDIGRWWMGLKKIGDPVRGSYGIHGVNVQKANDFYKKNFDWRNGSAGCPNIQGWYLQFLAKVVPVGAHVNIVQKDKWKPEVRSNPSAA
jgi:hypothetical protein